jgi:DNA invertase Pin-like site-specific DNA recombinase
MKVVSYYRVSTVRQGQSGLGLEAQKAAVEAFVNANHGELLRAYTEVESGKRSDRPELKRALDHAKLAKATLVVAKLDRLARNVEFLARVMNAGTEFVACDLPSANRMMLHIMAAVAENEAKATSDRTKAALAAYKARGGLLGGARPGSPRMSAEAMAKGQMMASQVRRKLAREAYVELVPVMAVMRSEGRSYRDIADRLNEQGYATRHGRPWSHVQVRLVLGRAQAA